VISLQLETDDAEEKDTMEKGRIVTMGALLLTMMLLIPSCVSMRVTDQWRDETFQGPAYKKIMVVALTKRADLRKPTEDEFSRQFKARGVDTVVCYECIPDVDQLSREGLLKVGEGKGVEAYLLVRVLRTEMRIESRQSSSQPSSTSLGMDSMMSTNLSGSPDPPVSRRTEVATLDARLFDGRSTKLVWRSTIESVDPAGDGSGIAAFVRAVLAALGDEKLLLQSK
jgi:hypothetical protein